MRLPPAPLAVRRLVTILAVLTPFSGTPAFGQVYLEPEAGVFTPYEWEWHYARNLREVLLKDLGPNHQARMICCPSSSPEWVVNIVRQGEGELFRQGTREYSVEYAGAEEIIFNDKLKLIRPRVRKAQAPLDRETAEAVSEAWHRMLTRVRAQGLRNRPEDGVTYHFSRNAGLVEGGPPPGIGQGVARMNDEEFIGPTGQLAEIGVALKEYVTGKPERRDHAAARVRGLAKRLNTQLSAAKRPG